MNMNKELHTAIAAALAPLKGQTSNVWDTVRSAYVVALEAQGIKDADDARKAVNAVAKTLEVAPGSISGNLTVLVKIAAAGVAPEVIGKLSYTEGYTIAYPAKSKVERARAALAKAEEAAEAAMKEAAEEAANPHLRARRALARLVEGMSGDQVVALLEYAEELATEQAVEAVAA
jgi:hypothetical protein